MKHLHHKVLSVAAAIVGLAFIASYSLRFSTHAPVNAPVRNDVAAGAAAAPSARPAEGAGTAMQAQGTPTGGQAPSEPDPDAAPLANALGRVTKKPFGLYVTRKNSPVQPERFSGYHCGTDFETTPEEKNADVVVSAICDGPLALKRTASGYGGVAVQRCSLGPDAVTVIYGHLRLSSITADIGEELKKGQRVGLLGTGFSKETDGERKHLHLGIHKGVNITLSGYVQAKTALADWMDAVTLMR